MLTQFNQFRLHLQLTWNEFYLVWQVHESCQQHGTCTLSRQDMANNLGISKQATIELVKKVVQQGWLSNVQGQLMPTEKWTRKLTDSTFIGQESLPSSHESVKKVDHPGQESLPVSKEYRSRKLTTPAKILDQYPKNIGQDSLPIDSESVKKVDQYQKNIGQESLPTNPSVVKKVDHQNQEIVEQKTESVKKVDRPGQESLPAEEREAPYIYNTINNNTLEIKNNITRDNNIRGSDEKISEVAPMPDTAQAAPAPEQPTKPENPKPDKPKPYELEQDEAGISTCKVLREMLRDYWRKHPNKYSKEMVMAFLQHYSAPDGNGKPKWYKLKTAKNGTFDLPLRLATWHKNEENFKQKDNGKIKKPDIRSSSRVPHPTYEGMVATVCNVQL